jgi:capsid portal protein
MLTNTKVKIPEGVVFQPLAEETVVLNMDSGLFFGLTPVASRTWELLAAGHSPQEVHKTLLEEYDVDPVVLENDLQELLRKLTEKGLLQLADVA